MNDEIEKIARELQKLARYSKQEYAAIMERFLVAVDSLLMRPCSVAP